MKKTLLTAEQSPILPEAIEESKKTMRDLYASLPSLPYSVDRPRYRPLAGAVDHLRSHLLNRKLVLCDNKS